MTEVTDIEEIQRNIRKEKNCLTSIGTGVVFFAFWIVVKMVAYLYFSRNEILSDPEVQDMGAGIYFMGSGLFILFSWGVHIYIGLSARAEGNGRRRKGRYMAVLTVWMAIYLCAVFLDIFGLTLQEMDLFDVVASVLIDLTMAVMLSELIVATVRLRKLRRQAGGE